MNRTLLVGAVLAVVLVVVAPMAQADGWRFSDGRWRLEMSGTGITYSKKSSRDGDSLFTGSVEYEWPVHARTTLGLKAYPLFHYRQSDPSQEIWGAGGGVAARYYQNADDLDGWYAEGGGALIWQSGYIEGNTSRVNFLAELGVGYQFPETDWHVALKYQHISNGGMGGSNAGVNAAALTFGYTF